MKTDCKDAKVLIDVNANCTAKKKVLTEVVNEDSEVAKKCGNGVNFEKWTPMTVDALKCDGIPVKPRKRVDIPADKGIFG